MKSKKNTRKRKRQVTSGNTKVVATGSSKISQRYKLLSAYAAVIVIAISLLLLC